MSQYKPTVEEFLRDVKDHQLTIKLDQGVYRHLVCANKNGSWNQRFEIITAPHSLLIRGDMGAVAFSRIEDMFQFFSSDPAKINPYYWGEKIEGLDADGGRNAYKFNGDYFREKLMHRVYDSDTGSESPDEIMEQLDNCVDWQDEEAIVIRAVGDFESNERFSFTDVWEINATVPLGRFIWLCRAICWAIGEYERAREAAR